MRVLTPEQIARICHESNRALCLSYGDNSVVPWEWAPKWQRDTVLEGVRLHLKNPGTTAEQSHESWRRKKIEDGWRYGATKNSDAKEHPCMVPYDQLPVEQQIKDVLFGGVVATLHHAAIV